MCVRFGPFKVKLSPYKGPKNNELRVNILVNNIVKSLVLRLVFRNTLRNENNDGSLRHRSAGTRAQLVDSGKSTILA